MEYKSGKSGNGNSKTTNHLPSTEMDKAPSKVAKAVNSAKSGGSGKGTPGHGSRTRS